MKKALAFVAMAALLSVSSGAWAQDQKPVKALDGGVFAYDISGARVTVLSVRDNNTFRHDQSTMYGFLSNEIEYYKTDDGKTRTRVKAAPTFLAHDTASSQGLVKGAAVGFISNLPNAGGLIGMGALLRPSSTNVSNDGGNQTVGNVTAEAKTKQFQGQAQGQLQGQQQKQKLDVPGGINNTNTNSIDFNGGGNTLTFSPITQ